MSTAAISPVDVETGRMEFATRHRLSRRVAIDVVGALDVAAVILSSILPAWIYAQVGGADIRWIVVLQTGLVTALLLYAFMQAWSMYDTTRLHDLPVAPGRLLAALLLSATAAMGIGIPFGPGEIHFCVWYASWIAAAFTAILGSRLLARNILARLTARGLFDTRIAVFGAGEIARRVQDDLKANRSGIHFAGVYDDRPKDRVDSDGLEIRGRLEDLVAAGRNGSIDQIVIALPQSADRRMSLIAARLEQLPVSLHIVTHIASDLVGERPSHRVSTIGSVGLLDVKAKPLTDWSPFVKRAEDLVLGTLFLIVALPLMALIALAIRIDSPGPIVFRQRRGGLNLSDIHIYKFRTMHVVEECGEIEQARANDPRVTRVGAFLRRTSLDELPQLFNVLKGEMSLVGPRPHAVSHDRRWSEQIAAYGMRHQMKPGITGLAQVEGCRGEILHENDLAARVSQDVAYIRNWSLALDLRILARTIRTMLTGRNAR